MIKSKLIDKAYDILFCVLVMVLPLNTKIPNILICFFLLFLSYYSKKTDYSLYNKSSYKLFFLLIVFWISKSILLGTFSQYNFALFIPLIILPLIYSRVKSKIYVLYALVVSGILFSFSAGLNIFKYFLKNGELLPFEGSIINDIIGAERPYLSFFIIIGILSGLEIFRKGLRYKFLFVISTIIFIVFIFLISARIATISLVLVFIIYFLAYIKESILKKAILFATFVSFVFCLIAVNKNIRERFFITKSCNEFFYKLNRHEPRVIIWDCAYDISRSENFNLLTGISSKTKLEDMFKSCFLQKITNKYREEYFLDSINNSHNQFINTYLISGIIGLSLFIAFFVLQMIEHRKNFFKFGLIICLLMFLMVENILSREMGVYMFSLAISLVNTND